MLNHPGELAALGAALCWTVGSQMNEAAGHRVGAVAINALRLLIALAFLTVWVVVAGGSVLPRDFTSEQIGWLAASGFIGLFLGDMCLFRAFIVIGPRLAMLIMSLSAPLTAILGRVFLDETYVTHQWLGMFVTLAGVAWVIMERQPEHLSARMVETPHPRIVRRVTTSGVLLGLGAVVGQAGGAIMAKHGMGDGDAFAATQVRFAAAAVALLPTLAAIGYLPRVGRAMRDKRAMLLIVAAAIIGSAIGVALSLVAFKLTETGVAATILALVPILLIPLAIVINREHVSWRAAAGAVVAFVGVFLLVYEF